MTRKAIVMVAVVIISTGGLLAAGKTSSSKNVTVGEFVSRLAVEMGKEAPDSAAVVRTLKGLGVKLSADLNAPLTDAVVARIAADLGMDFRPSANPAGEVSSSRATVLASLMGERYFSEGRATTIDDPPNECLSSVNRGTCVECCKEATGEGGKFCGRFCHDNVPPGESEEEPQP